MTDIVGQRGWPCYEQHTPLSGPRRALAVNELVHDRAFSVAMTSASLVGIALPRRWIAPEPDYDD